MTTEIDLMLSIALAELGVREVPGPRSNPRIFDYYAAAGIGPKVALARHLVGKVSNLGKDDSTTAWCGCFEAFVVRGIGHEPPENAYRARSWETWGFATLQPIPGCIAVLSRPPKPYNGHVATYIGSTMDGRIALLGGNQGNSVSLALYPNDRVLTYRYPPSLPSPGLSRGVS